MKNLQAIDIVYNKAPDSQKTWIETTNRYWLDGGLRYFKKSLENHVQLSKTLADSILNNLPKKPIVVLDIGAGYGGVSINFALRGIKVIAVEPSATDRRVIKYLVNRHSKAKGSITVIDGFAESLHIAKNSIDLCILSQVLEHVDDPEKTMREVSRVLKKNGYCHLTSPNYLFPVEQHYKIPYFPLMRRRLFSKWAIFLFKTLNLRNVKNVESRDFSQVESFIKTIVYTTDKMIVKLCRKNNLKIVWSAREYQKNVFKQIITHWRQNPKLIQIPLILLSLPKKIFRSILALVGILPIKLEYIIQKNSVQRTG